SDVSSSSAAHSEESAVSFTRADLVIPASGSQPAQTVAVTVATTSDGRQSVTLPAAALSQILPMSKAAAGAAVLPSPPLTGFAASSEAPPPAVGAERHSSLTSSPAATATALTNPAVVFSNPAAVTNLLGTPAAENPAAAAAALLNTASAMTGSSAGGINPCPRGGGASGAMPLTLQSLQGTLASASLASSLLRPSAPPYSLQAGGGVGLMAGESTGGSSVSAWSSPSLSSGMGMGPGLGPPGREAAGMATAATLSAGTAATTGAARQGVAKDAKVKVLLNSGGAFSRCPSGFWEYNGGETRLVAVPRTETYRELASAIARAVSIDLNEEAPLILKYELPGLPDQLVDLLTDDDVGNMWEALEEYCIADQKPTFKLKILVQQAVQMSSAAG
ncbi:hypothetical protein Vafri_297, partial [Volvox africanus]